MAGVDLGKQVGPLPLGAWLVVVAGGLGIAWYTRSNGGGGNSEPVTVDDTSGQPGVGTGAVGGWQTTQPDTTAGAGAAAPTTNEEWAYRATQYLISIGIPSTVAQSATSKYIAEQTLSVQEYSAIAMALIRVGPLPSPLSNAPGAPTTPTTTVMKAPTGLKASRVDRLGVKLDWTPIPGVKGYSMYVNGKQVGNSVLYSTGYVGVAKSNTTYTIGVAGVYSGDKKGPIATISVKSKK